MMRTVFFSSQGERRDLLQTDDIRKVLQQHDGLLWVNLEDPPDEEINSILADVFKFHPLTIEDCLNSGYQTPKVDDFGNYIFIIVHAFRNLDDMDQISFGNTSELDVYLGDNFLVTVHHAPSMHAIDSVWKRLDFEDRLHNQGADFLCHAVLDALVDEYLPLLDRMDDEIDWLEDRVLQEPDPLILKRILSLKHAVMYLRRMLLPQREVMNRLSRDEFSMINKKSRIYFRDLYDHLVRIHDLTESIREVVSGALDIYLSSTSLKQNNIMKTLAIVSTTFLPLSFIAGVFGMNFIFNKDYALVNGLPLFIGLSVLTIVIMIFIFKHMKWL